MNILKQYLSTTFCYFDQGHITGIDIKLDLSARALITITNICNYSNTAQAFFRLRNINKGQKGDMIHNDQSIMNNKYKMLIKLINNEIDFQERNYYYFISQCSKYYYKSNI